MDTPSVFHIFWWYTQINLEYPMQNTINHLIQVHHSMLEPIFRIYCFCIGFLLFPCIVDTKVDDTRYLFFLFKSILLVKLSINLCGCEVLLFPDFLNIVSIFFLLYPYWIYYITAKPVQTTTSIRRTLV